MTSPVAEIAARVAAALPADRRALVGVDGVDGSGKTTFAARVAEALDRPTVVIHLDDFLNPATRRHRRGRRSPHGFWLDTYDYVAIARDVLQPLGTTGDGWYRSASLDPVTDARVKPPRQQAPRDAVVIVEGMFLHRAGLAAVWDCSVWLDVSFTETARRMATRDGTHPDPEHKSMRRYVGGQRLYFAAAEPWTRATFVVDNTDPRHPRVVERRT
jgi:uridine kinase